MTARISVAPHVSWNPQSFAENGERRITPLRSPADAGLKPGAQFVVLGDRDVVILKVIQSPDMSGFDEIVGRARKAAKQSGRKKKDVAAAVRTVRNRK